MIEWITCEYEDIADEPVDFYKEFAISLEIPNGGITGVSIWNSDKSICESAWTEEFDKYHDEDWHIQKAKERINQILKDDKQLQLF